MEVYVVYCDDLEYGACVQGIYSTMKAAKKHKHELSHRMDQGYYAHEEYPYIRVLQVRDEYDRETPAAYGIKKSNQVLMSNRSTEWDY